MSSALTLQALLQSPLHQQERWKYANVSHLKAMAFVAPGLIDENLLKRSLDTLRGDLGKEACLIVMVNGEWQAHLSDVLPAGCHAELFVSPKVPTTLIDPIIYPFAALNQASQSTGLRLRVDANAVISSNITLVSMVDASHTALVQPTVCVELGVGSTLNVIEVPMMVGDSTALINQLVYIRTLANANLTWVKLQTLQANATQLSHYAILQMKDSRTNFINLTKGARFSRDEVVVDLQESGAVAKTSGFYQLTRDEQFVDNHVEICHAAPHTDSEMLYKGSLDGASQAVFNGRLLVKEGAQKITAYQANHNLLLSNAAEVYSKPELEIYADDVKCKHGATIGQIDEDAIFYLQSRGIDKKDARAMLMAGFMDEVMAMVPFEAVRAMIKTRMAYA